jgi:hypothetical protein
MVENSETQLADVVLMVEGDRFPAHRCVIAERSEYFKGLLLSGMHGGAVGGWGTGDRSGGSERGEAPGGDVVPLHG